MKKFEVKVPMGTGIYNFAKLLISTFHEKSPTYNVVWGEFNGVIVEYDNSSITVDDIVRTVRKELACRAQEMNNSPEGKKQAAEDEKKLLALQGQADQLMHALGLLDFTKISDVELWCNAMLECSDHIGVKVDKEQLINTFRQHGFLPNVGSHDSIHKIINQCFQSVNAYQLIAHAQQKLLHDAEQQG